MHAEFRRHSSTKIEHPNTQIDYDILGYLRMKTIDTDHTPPRLLIQRIVFAWCGRTKRGFGSLEGPLGRPSQAPHAAIIPWVKVECAVVTLSAKLEPPRPGLQPTERVPLVRMKVR